MKKCLIALAATLMTSAAVAGDNRCIGVVSAGKVGKITDTNADRICTFAINSKVGRKILSTCPVGSTCEIEMPLPPGGDIAKWIERHGDEIKGRFHVERVK